MTEKNEISYSKAINLMKAYYQQEQYKSQSISNPNYLSQVQNKTKVNSSTEFINKSSSNINTYAIKDDLILIDDKEAKLNQQLVQGLNNMKNNPQQNKLNKTPSQSNSSFQNKNENTGPTSKQEAEKQNISIVLINNHINRYIINSQDPNSNPQDTSKRPKNNINTFRSSYQLAPNYMTESQINKKGPELRQNNVSQPVLSQNNSKLNLKHLNIEVRNPLMKNSTPTEQLGTSKYSSLLDNQVRGSTPNNAASYNQSQVTRPSSAVAMKGRHTRETSGAPFKNENPQNYHPIVRSPSSQNIAQNGLNRNFSKTSLNQKKETPRNNYFISNYDVSKSIGMGNKTVRPSSTNDKIRINYTGNINPLSSMNNINHIKVANRYDIDELVNRRGYSLSSRATDLRPSYRFKDYEPKYHTPSNKFSASGIYRSNPHIKK